MNGPAVLALVFVAGLLVTVLLLAIDQVTEDVRAVRAHRRAMDALDRLDHTRSP